MGRARANPFILALDPDPMKNLYFYAKTHKRPSLSLPPGPKKLPLPGNLLDLPKTERWLKYIEWGEEFSRFLVLGLPDKLIESTL